MKKLFCTLLAIVLISALILGGCAEPAPAPTPAPAPAPAPAPPPEAITLRLGHDLPPFTTPGLGMGVWAELVNERAEGRVVVEVYPTGSLAEQQTGVEALHAGVADAYMVAPGSHRHLFPFNAIRGLPGLGFPDTVEGQKAHTDAWMALIDKYPAAADELKDYKVIFDMINPNCILLSATKEIRTPDDCKGMKIGASGLNLHLVESLGAAAVEDTPFHAYQNIQTGIIEATTSIHFCAISEFKTYEVAPYAFDISWGQSGLPLLMSRNSWNKVSAMDQQIMLDAGQEGWRVAAEAVAERGDIGKQAMLDFGGTIAEPTAAEKALWDEKFALIWEEWITERENAGVTNARDALNEWKTAVEKAWGE